MITNRTAIVLGAGASAAYGFPLGSELKIEVATRLIEKGPKSDAAVVGEASNASPVAVEEFRVALSTSQDPSIDSFIERHGKKYDEIGRNAIALALLQLESDEALYPRNGDWYGRFFELGLRDVDSFRSNVRVMNFNFERSYQRRLFLDLSKKLAGTERASDVYLDEVFAAKVQHIHGSFGWPSWQRLHLFGPPHSMTDYLPSREPGRVASAAANIRLFPDPITEGMRRMLAETFDWAERILFLGFSYHPSNLEKLGSPGNFVGKDVRGTVLGMSAAAISGAVSDLGGSLQPFPKECGVFDAIALCEWFR